MPACCGLSAAIYTGQRAGRAGRSESRQDSNTLDAGAESRQENPGRLLNRDSGQIINYLMRLIAGRRERRQGRAGGGCWAGPQGIRGG